jgi:transcriptional regulator with XRE-family HTH domain
MPIPKYLRTKLTDSEFAHAYVDEFLSLSIATQLKVLREQRTLTQEELAHLAGMKQERISVLENVNYASWSISTLRKLAKALDVVLKVSFETFGSRALEMKNVSREFMERDSRTEEIARDNED